MRLSHLALAGVLLLGPTACSSEEPVESGDTDARGTVLQPGKPGEENQTLDPDATVEQPATNDADIEFMQLMVPHHAQALEMSELAQSRARGGQVVAIARRIKGAQGPEIVGMSSWLQSRDLEVPESMAAAAALAGHGDHDGHGDHGDAGGDDEQAPMHGMLTGQEMSELADARGREFDRLFLVGMIQHHEGAVTMAREEMEAGSDTVALELAADIAAGQQDEIRRMVDIRRDL